MFFFRDLARCCIALLLTFVGSTTAFGQQAPAIDLTTPKGKSDLDLARVTRWVNAGMSRRPLGPNLFQVPVGSSMTGFVSLATMPEGPMSLLGAGIAGTHVLVRIFVPATGHDEVFLLYVPPTHPSVKRPLLTAFHSYDISHGSIATLTTYLREAEVRDWFLVAPIQSGGPGYTQVSYGSPQSQEHVEAVIRLLLDYYSIDRDRLYGVGFSMGGGSVMSYAARHRDRRKGSFAAVLNHTGSVSLSDTYEFVPANVQTVMEALFFGSPTENPFDWTRASSIVLDASSQLVPGADHMAINLAATPVKTIYGLTDPELYLINQSIQLDQFFLSAGATNHILEPTVTSPVTCPGGHCWDTADETLVCDWFDTITLNSNPASGTILTDRSIRWGHYDVTTGVADAFAGVDFAVDAATNSITFSNVRNLQEIGVDVTRIGLDPATSISFNVQSGGPNGETYRLRSFQSAPMLVERNSQPVGSACPSTPGAPSWCLESTSGDLVLHEPGGTGTATWRILP